MCQRITIFSALLVITQTISESTEEQQPLTYNYFYPPSTLNFHDLYSNSLALLTDEPTGPTPLKDDEFHLNSVSSQFSEFPHHIQTVPTVTTPVYNNSSEKNSLNTTKSGKDNENSDDSVQVLPMQQRGVLDLLFPTSRVRGFKSVFDAFRKMLSNTFR